MNHVYVYHLNHLMYFYLIYHVLLMFLFLHVSIWVWINTYENTILDGGYSHPF